MARDPDFAARFLVRHQAKLMFGSDCACLDGHGAGQTQAAVKDKCIARETLALLKKLAPPEMFQRLVFENGARFYGLA